MSKGSEEHHERCCHRCIRPQRGCQSRKGSLKNTNPIEYSAQVLRGVLDKVPQLPAEAIEDVILGCAKPELTQRYNIGRLVALRAQLPYSVPGQTVNRFCASSLQAISTGANMIRSGEAEVIVAGGVESMTDIPYMGIATRSSATRGWTSMSQAPT